MADLEELLRAVGDNIVAVAEEIKVTSDLKERKQLRREEEQLRDNLLLLLQSRYAAGNRLRLLACDIALKLQRSTPLIIFPNIHQ